MVGKVETLNASTIELEAGSTMPREVISNKACVAFAFLQVLGAEVYVAGCGQKKGLETSAQAHADTHTHTHARTHACTHAHTHTLHAVAALTGKWH